MNKTMNINAPVIDWTSTFASFEAPKFDWNAGRQREEITVAQNNNIFCPNAPQTPPSAHKRKREFGEELTSPKKNITENYFSNSREMKNKESSFFPVTIQTFQQVETPTVSFQRKRRQEEGFVENYSKKMMRRDPRKQFSEDSGSRSLSIVEDESGDFISLKDIKKLDADLYKNDNGKTTNAKLPLVNASSSFRTPSKESIRQIFNTYYKNSPSRTITPQRPNLSIVPYNNFSPDLLRTKFLAHNSQFQHPQQPQSQQKMNTEEEQDEFVLDQEMCDEF